MQPITVNKFNKFTNSQKWGILEDYGTYLDVSIIKEGFQIALYQLYNYYVEVRLQQSNDKLKSATAFTSYKKLDTFIKGVDISSIYSVL